MTKTPLIIATALAGLLATPGAADNYFALSETLDRRSTLDLGQVRAEGTGIVQIYDYHKGRQGALLGTTDVRPGANYDVRVHVGRRPRNDVIAVLRVDGRVVATRDYDIE